MKVVQTTLTEAEHRLLEEYAKKNSKTIKEVLRSAIRRALDEKINPDDSIFSAPAVSKSTGKKDRGSLEHDKYLYGEKN